VEAPAHFLFIPSFIPSFLYSYVSSGTHALTRSLARLHAHALILSLSSLLTVGRCQKARARVEHSVLYGDNISAIPSLTQKSVVHIVDISLYLLRNRGLGGEGLSRACVMRVRVCVRACVCARLLVCLCACVHVCVRACVLAGGRVARVRACARARGHVCVRPCTPARPCA